MSISENLRNLQQQVPSNVKIIAVSKTQPVDIIMELYNAGHRLFGENKVQELLLKQSPLPHDIEWHFMGHLQRNKVRYIIPFISMIQSIDSFRLLQEVNKEAQKISRIVPCLLQFHIASEETKYGLDWNEAVEIFESPDYTTLQSIQLCGVMGMATLTNDPSILATEFRNLTSIFARIKENYFYGDPAFSEISMGMSGDYQQAIKMGSTIIRVGTLIFGERNQ
ncbi:MAG: YggS family pyridoxal phosphate-dependent enzyme [bacterium]